MVKVFHISERENRNSILEKGVVPTKISLQHHAESFLSKGIIANENSKVSYFWIDSERNEKYIKDMIYCKYWIHPRNYMVDAYYRNNNDLFDFSDLDNHWLKKDNGLFDIYTADAEDPSNNCILHGQFPSSSKHNSCYRMDEKYSHENKILYITPDIIKDLKIVGSVLFNADISNKTMRFSFYGPN